MNACIILLHSDKKTTEWARKKSNARLILWFLDKDRLEMDTERDDVRAIASKLRPPSAFYILLLNPKAETHFLYLPAKGRRLSRSPCSFIHTEMVFPLADSRPAIAVGLLTGPGVE